jgi:hypothetical protein
MATSPPISENPLLAQIRQQARQQAQTPDTPPPSLMPPPGMDTGAPPIMPQAQQPNVQAPRGTLTGEKNEQARLVGSKPGMSQVYDKITGSDFGQNHPLAGKLLGGAAQGLSTLGNIALSGAAPKLASLVPGTSAHHGALVGQENQNVNQLEGQQEKEAQTKNLEIQPQLRLATQALANQKQVLANQKQDETEQHHQQQIAEQLHAHGFDQDETGKIVPLSYDQMSAGQQAVHDLKGSQEELADARAAYVKAQKDNAPVLMEMAHQRILTAQRNASTAAGKLGLDQKKFAADYYGTDTENNALPGVPATEAGGPEGLKIAALTKPPAVAQGKASQGQAVVESANDLKKFIDQNPQAFGHMDQYWQQYINGTPISDPTASKAMAKIASFAALQPALHGFRSHDAMREFGKMIGGIPKNPEALKSAIDGLVESAANPMIHAGTMRTVDNMKNGGAGVSNAPKEGDSKTNSAGDKLTYTGGKWQLVQSK